MMFSCGLEHMDTPVLADQQKIPSFSFEQMLSTILARAMADRDG